MGDHVSDPRRPPKVRSLRLYPLKVSVFSRLGPPGHPPVVSNRPGAPDTSSGGIPPWVSVGTKPRRPFHPARPSPPGLSFSTCLKRPATRPRLRAPGRLPPETQAPAGVAGHDTEPVKWRESPESKGGTVWSSAGASRARTAYDPPLPAIEVGGPAPEGRGRRCNVGSASAP